MSTLEQTLDSSDLGWNNWLCPEGMKNLSTIADEFETPARSQDYSMITLVARPRCVKPIPFPYLVTKVTSTMLEIWLVNFVTLLVLEFSKWFQNTLELLPVSIIISIVFSTSIVTMGTLVFFLMGVGKITMKRNSGWDLSWELWRTLTNIEQWDGVTLLKPVS